MIVTIAAIVEIWKTIVITRLKNHHKGAKRQGYIGMVCGRGGTSPRESVILAGPGLAHVLHMLGLH